MKNHSRCREQAEMCINWELKSKGKIRPKNVKLCEPTTIAGLEQT